MSRATELAQAEAARAETENPEPQPDAEPDTDTDTGSENGENGDGDGQEDAPSGASPPPPAPLTEAELEKAFRALDRESDRHARRVHEIVAGGTPLYPCPTCAEFPFVGFVPEPPAAAPELQDAPDRETCEVCKGAGQVKSGSLRPGHDVIDCSTCGGWGHMPKAAPQPITVTAVAPAPPRADVQALRDAGYVVIDPMQPANAS